MIEKGRHRPFSQETFWLSISQPGRLRSLRFIAALLPIKGWLIRKWFPVSVFISFQHEIIQQLYFVSKHLFLPTLTGPYILFSSSYLWQTCDRLLEFKCVAPPPSPHWNFPLYSALTKAQVISAWVTLGGGWSKFQVQSQQTATVLRWRILSAPALWVFLLKHPVRCFLCRRAGAENEILIWRSQTDLTEIITNFVSVGNSGHICSMAKSSRSRILSFSTTSSIKMPSDFQKLGSISAKN